MGAGDVLHACQCTSSGGTLVGVHPPLLTEGMCTIRRHPKPHTATRHTTQPHYKHTTLNTTHNSTTAKRKTKHNNTRKQNKTQPRPSARSRAVELQPSQALPCLHILHVQHRLLPGYAHVLRVVAKAAGSTHSTGMQAASCCMATRVSLRDQQHTRLHTRVPGERRANGKRYLTEMLPPAHNPLRPSIAASTIIPPPTSSSGWDNPCQCTFAGR